MSDTSTKEVSDRTPPMELPKGAYAYRFFAQREVTQDGETLRGKPCDYSGTTYFGEALTLEQVKALPGDYRILVGNMECNGWARVVRTIRGNFVPFDVGDSVITP